MTFHSKVYLTVLCCFFAFGLSGQILGSLHMVWDDNVSQWVAQDLDGEDMAEIRLTWATSDVLNAWTIDTPTYTAELKTKWPDNFNLWEMNVQGNWITARTIMNDRFDRWRLKIGDKTYTYQRAWSGRWELRSIDGEQWFMETQFQGDIRDWVIESNIDVWPDGLEYVMAMLAITMELQVR